MSDIFGIHSQALLLHEKRAEVLANNLINASTPNFKAQDIDFVTALTEAQNDLQNQGGLTHTHDMHLAESTTSQNHYYYRTAEQASLDQNTVDTNVEQTKFTENALQYQASLSFINHKIHGLMSALKGE